jgi:hypothetical protein
MLPPRCVVSSDDDTSHRSAVRENLHSTAQARAVCPADFIETVATEFELARLPR